MQTAVPAQAHRLVQAVTALSAARDVAGITAIVREAARDLTGADGATFVLRDGEHCHYLDEDAIAPLWKGRRFPMSSCVSGWVMREGQSTVIPDIYADERVPHDAYQPTFVKSMAMVPIRASDPLGAIGTYWARPHRPAPRDVEAVEALANTTAVALENVRIQQELEARVQQRTSALVAANQELEAFTHAVSHDLRAPLRGISSYAALLARRHRDLPAPSLEMLGNVQDKAVRMDRLLDSLLQLSAASGPLRPVEVHMRDLVGEVVADVRKDWPGRDVEVAVADDLPLCTADATLMRQVLHNLLGNAFKFTKADATPRVCVGGHMAGAEAVYFVQDNGAGFDPAQAGSLFRPFASLHDRGQFPGTGIGLSIVARVVHRHGGRVWAEALPGRGATFYFTVPRVLPAAPDGVPSGAP